MDRKIKVITYSGYKADERPLFFFPEGIKLGIHEILKQWKDREYDYFNVIGTDDNRYILKWARYKDQWFVEKKDVR